VSKEKIGIRGSDRLFCPLLDPRDRGEARVFASLVSPAQTRSSLVARLALEMDIAEEKPQDLESEPIEIDSDDIQKVIAIIEKIES
jgi:hypothetical protein